jgi:hypothetical protein
MKKIKKMVWLLCSTILLAGGSMGCSSTGESKTSKNQTASKAQAQSQKKGETQLEKFQRLILADNEKLVIGSDNTATIKSIEAVFQPQVISGIDEITDTKLSEPARPYYFKIRAIYKGHDIKAEKIFLQDLEQKQSNVMDTALGAVFGVDTNSYPIDYVKAIATSLPTEANATADFYLVAAKFTENEGKKINETLKMVRFVRNIEKPSFDPSKFIVANGMRYITVNDARVTTQQDVMMNYFTGGAITNSSGSVFDPTVYPLVDLLDARVAMDKKDIRNDYTFPKVKVKYVSFVLFKGQSNTTITVSTDDNFLTERMNFSGRASTIRNNEKILVYYTIAKDPLEKWEIQAIERL